MGGWLMLLAARSRPEKVVGLVGIAPAPDFTDWGFTTDEKMALLQNGRQVHPGRGVHVERREQPHDGPHGIG